MDDDQSDAKRRRVHAPNSRGDVPPRTLDGINAVLEEHARQIETLAAANKVLEGRNAALEERCKALDRKSESLKRSCDKLEVRCISMERSIQVLKKDVNWSYSAPYVPRDYWIEQGHDEEYTNNVDWCIERIKENAQAIRRSKSQNFCCSCLDYGDQLTILHDDALLPHFKELADAIQVSNGIEQICIDNMELGPSALSILCPVMEGRVLDIVMQSLRFPAKHAAKCYEIITTSIRRNHALKELSWVGNQISSDEQADQLIDSAIDNRFIKTVCLQECFSQEGANGCRALVALMTRGRPFEELDFSGNDLSGIDDVAAALATNPKLKKLWIHDNRLNDRDAELIAQALKQNTNLQELLLDDNSITSAGFEMMSTAIYDLSSLNAMESCNHTCWVDCVEGIRSEAGKIKRMTPRQRRNRKLYKLLSTRHAEGSNARHLNAELGEEKYTIKLVPRVLHCIKRYSSDRAADSSLPLSITFELIKSWMMPELFEHH